MSLLKTSAIDSDGTLQIKAGGNTAVTVTAGGLLGVGTASPDENFKLTIQGSTGLYAGTLHLDGTMYYANYATPSEAIINVGSNHPLKILTNNTERIHITANGNIGIGTSSPIVGGITGSGPSLAIGNSTDTHQLVSFAYNTGGQIEIWNKQTNTFFTAFGASIGETYIYAENNTPMNFYTGDGTERMQIGAGFPVSTVNLREPVHWTDTDYVGNMPSITAEHVSGEFRFGLISAYNDRYLGSDYCELNLGSVIGESGYKHPMHIMMDTTRPDNQGLRRRFRLDPNGSFYTNIPDYPGMTSTQNGSDVGVVLWPTYFCRAWVNFNGTGTVAIRGSGNVSSITDNDVGDYTVNFSTAMPDANYCFSGAGTRSSLANQLSCVQYGTTAPSTTSQRIVVIAGGDVRVDALYCSVSFFR